jgi:hypothetical protein
MLSDLTLLWRAPLALASFLLLRAARRVLEWQISWAEARHPDEGTKWVVFSADRLRRPLELAVLMVQAPRWNPHAIIATAGPFPVHGPFRIRRAQLDESSPLWFLLCYRKPGYARVAVVSSLTADSASEWIDVAVEPGRYILVLRYYRFGEQVTLPDVVAEGGARIAAVTVSASVNEFYRDLARRDSVFYRMLHYYVHVLLEYRHLLPEAFIRREYLPAGNPATEFYYGLVPQGKELEVEVRPELLTTHEVLLTLYSSASFPLAWCRLQEPRAVLAALQARSYLVRVQRTKQAEQFPKDAVQISWRARALRNDHRGRG